MNRYLVTSLLAFAAAAATTSAFADDLTHEFTPFVSSKTRAEVQAELRQFPQNGLDPWFEGYDHSAGFRSERTRAEVLADYFAAREQVEAMTGEDSGAGLLAGQHSGAL